MNFTTAISQVVRHHFFLIMTAVGQSKGRIFRTFCPTTVGRLWFLAPWGTFGGSPGVLEEEAQGGP